MVIPTWYIRERCPSFVYLPDETQWAWLMLLEAEFNSTRIPSVVDPVQSWDPKQITDGVPPQEVHEEMDPAQQVEGEGPLVTLTVPLTWSVTSIQIHWSIRSEEEVRGPAEPECDPDHSAGQN